MVVSRSLFTIILSTGLPVAIERKGKENIKRGGGEEEAALPIRVKMHSCLLSGRCFTRERERRTPALDSSSGFQNFLSVATL